MEYKYQVFVDTFSWIEEISRTGEIVITGAYRVGYLHARVFIPAVITTHDSPLGVDFFEAKRKLEDYLHREITVIYLDVDSFDRCVFLCLGVDHFPPCFNRPPIDGVIRATILHDVLAAKGKFRADAKWRYELGMRNFEMFLYVSKTSLEEFRNLALEKDIDISDRIFIPCSNSHSYNEDTFETTTKIIEKSKESRQSLSSLSVHSIYPYKNIFRTIEVANFALYTHYHAGTYVEEDRNRWNEALERKLFTWFGRVDDNMLGQLYLTAAAFICCSIEEGFSLGAMEAILLGVPTIILSDIPVHREIYGGYNVNFISTTLGDLSFGKLKQVTAEDRRKVYQRHKYLSTIQPFLKYLEKELGMKLSK